MSYEITEPFEVYLEFPHHPYIRNWMHFRDICAVPEQQPGFEMAARLGATAFDLLSLRPEIREVVSYVYVDDTALLQTYSDNNDPANRGRGAGLAKALVEPNNLYKNEPGVITIGEPPTHVLLAASCGLAVDRLGFKAYSDNISRYADRGVMESQTTIHGIDTISLLELASNREPDLYAFALKFGKDNYREIDVGEWKRGNLYLLDKRDDTPEDLRVIQLTGKDGVVSRPSCEVCETGLHRTLAADHRVLVGILDEAYITQQRAARHLLVSLLERRLRRADVNAVKVFMNKEGRIVKIYNWLPGSTETDRVEEILREGFGAAGLLAETA